MLNMFDSRFSVFSPFLFFQKIFSNGLPKLDPASGSPIYVIRKTIIVSFVSTILAACGTPNQQDFEKEVAGRAENGMPAQEAIKKLKDFGLICTKYPKYFDCSRIKQNFVPPTSCTERLTFVQDEQGLVSDMTIWKPACAGF
jgi:hypothetical protein